MDSCSGLVDLLVYANRILAAHGIVDAMGHISVRHPLRPDLFFLSRSLAPAQVKRQDILCFDLDGNDVTGSGLHPYLERFIHAEMYRAKPEVVSVVHSHSPSVIPFGVTKTDLRPIYHMAGFLGDGAAHFDIGEHGDTDMLVRDSYLGKALAKTMGERCCVLMRGHGSTVIGRSIEQAVYRAIYTEQNCKLQWMAQMQGDVHFLNSREAALSAAMMDESMVRNFNLWLGEVRDIELGDFTDKLKATFEAEQAAR